MRELLDAEESSVSSAKVPEHVLQQIKVKLHKLDKFDEVWRSSGIASKGKASVWEGRLKTKLLARNRVRVCLGHFCAGNYAAPRTDKWDAPPRRVIRDAWAAASGGRAWFVSGGER